MTRDTRSGFRGLIPVTWAGLVGFAASAALAALAGCAGFTPQPGPAEEPGGRYRPLTQPFIAIGDTQEHQSTGYPMHDNDSAIDAYVEVAQRPPEQILFGRRLLESALHSHPGEPFLHLGDVMDLSCRSEADRMTRILRSAHAPGAILPGNHDGLMFGVYAYELIGPQAGPRARDWHRACRRGAAPDDARFKTDSEAFSKRDFIAHYLAEHATGQPAKPGLVAPPASGAHAVSWRSPDSESFLSAIEAQLLDGLGYADSFVAQRLNLPRAAGASRRTIVIGLDTNQAGPLVSSWDALMGRSPGSMGHIHPDQLKAVTKWVDEAIAAGDIVIFAGHHNWRSLGLPSRTLLRRLMARLDHPLVYLSAHTHRGFWALHRTLASQPLLELNVSSLSDWPIAYRRIHFSYDETARRLMVHGDLMPRGVRPNASDADLLAAWEARSCGGDASRLERLREEDRSMVKRQRDSRGSLLEWLVEFLGPVCERCEQPLYVHAQAYQDELLDVILQVDADLARDAHALHTVALPAWCGGVDFTVCTRALMAERPTDFRGHVDLFRRKAALVSLLNEHLDDLVTPEAKSYMTCRAVQAAKIDFDATGDDANDFRSEANRRAEQFFRIEASVGMQ